MGLHAVYLNINLRGGSEGISWLRTEMKGHLNNHHKTIIEIRAVPQKLHC